MQFGFIKCHGSGNDFPLIDARTLSLSETEWATLARLMADRDGPVGGDGLLALAPGREGAAFAMRMWNSDGSEAETCLNGLRCVARLGFEAFGIEGAEVALKQSMADVSRAEPIAPGVTTIRTRAHASTLADDVGLLAGLDQAIDTEIPGLPSARRFTAVAIPNPHLITFVDSVDEAELVALGDWCEARPALLRDRANVSFVELRGGGDLFVRTYERGVALTDSCGSAMASSAFAAGLTGRVPFGQPMRVFNKGGLVLATATAPEAGGEVTIQGNATFLYDATIEVDLAVGSIAAPVIHARREDEARAWEAAVAALS